MTFVNVTIKGLDEKKYRKIKSIAAEEGENVGQVLNEALDNYIELKKSKWKKIDLNDPLFSGEGRSNWGVDTDAAHADRHIYR